MSTNPTSVDPKTISLPKELRGERVICRPFCQADAEAFVDMYRESRNHLLRWLGGAEDIDSVQDACEALKKRQSAWNDRIDLAVAIVLLETGKLLGEGGLGPDWDTRTFELGFWLRPSAVGHGYMAEANRLACRWAFRDLGAARVVMSCDAENTRSAATALRIGLRQTGEVRTDDGGNSLRFEMTAAEYRAAPWSHFCRE